MTLRTSLEDFGVKNIEKPSLNIGKVVRNANYHMMTPEELGVCQSLVFECLLKHPDGINDKGIAVETGLPKSSVCARRNELMQMDLVESKGIGYFPDYKGRMRSNTLWGVKTNGGMI